MDKEADHLLELHRQHLGLYAKVAKTLDVTQSYVSLVANGRRQNKAIMAELIRILKKLR